MKKKLKQLERLVKYLNINYLNSINIKFVSENLFQEIKKQNTSLDKKNQEYGIDYKYRLDDNNIWFEYYSHLGKCCGTIEADEETLIFIIYELKKEAKIKAREEFLNEMSEIRVREVMSGRNLLTEKDG